MMKADKAKKHETLPGSGRGLKLPSLFPGEFFPVCMIFITALGIHALEGADTTDGAEAAEPPPAAEGPAVPGAESPAAGASPGSSEGGKFAENTVEASRYATIRYGTETEIASLIQALKNENADYLDDELVALVQNTRNRSILSGVFSFFSARQKTGLEDRAVRALEEWDEESGETVLTAIDYLGKIQAPAAIKPLKAILDSEERRFMNAAFRALGRASAADSESAGDAALYLIDYYTNRDPGDENRREIITALGEGGSEKAVEFLAGIAGNSEERMPLRIAALDSLGKIGDQAGVEAVTAAINDGDPNVRASAVAALGPFSGEEVDRAILEAFRDSYYRTRIAAAEASRVRKFEAAVPYLRFRAERDDVPAVKDAALRALGAIGNGECISILEKFFSDRGGPDRIRILSIEMLMKNEPAAFAAALIAELDEAKRKNQTALYNGFLKVIGEARAPGLEEITRRFFASGSAVEKIYALDMAANNGLRSLIPEVQAMKDDKNTGIARKAARTLEVLTAPAANPEH
ncbi:MAG: HEAT repeat domain-containing protein [Treponema sp.]|jgi:HEAT repeat protein|nr:HEAT repeat domain-containing protein [Treponema sp.]